MNDTKPNWNFRMRGRGERNREPIVSEFFTTNIMHNAAEALVRESVQNSLDAGWNGATVYVRFYLSGSKAMLPPERMSRYTTDGWPHFLAERNGLKNQPNEGESSPFLIIEDFGTSGLTGDIEQSRDEPNVRNPFYYFFRAEGQSGKGEQDRGRWGVGKTVFPRSSRIKTYFGYTVRQDDGRRLLMGQAVLRSHYVEGKYYSPDGYFGKHEQDGFSLPLEDQDLLEQFRQDFCLKRTGEPGLSVIIPWCDEEIEFDALLQAVLRQYYYAILSGNLHITIATPDREVLLSDETLLSEVRSLSGNLARELIPIIELTLWAKQQSSESILILSSPPDQNAHKWSNEWFSKEQIVQMRSLFEKGEGLAVRVPVTVRENKKALQQSFFDVFFIRDGNDESGRPVFVREGIIISDIRAPRNRGVRALVIVQDKPLATLLGDAENPAHTQWQKDSSNYKGKYVYGPSYIEFVTNSVSEIIKALTEDQKEIDPTLLLDIFSLPAPPEEEAPKTRKEKPQPNSGDESEEPEPPSPTSRRFTVQKVAGGFSVSKGGDNAQPPAVILIRVAYDIRRGNPLKKYNPADFDLRDMQTSKEGVDILHLERNEIRIAIMDPDFRLTVTGFDENRDIYVRAVAQEKDYDSED